VAERSQRRVSGTAAGNSSPPPAAPTSSGRRILSFPANDNAPGPLQRVVRVVLFVAIGAGLAWLLNMALR
jgi:hypothetical protein